MTALPLSKRVAALMAAGAVAAVCGIVAAMPAQAHAATNLTLDNVKNLPFYDAGHTAAKPVWKSTSKVIAVGGCKQCASIWYDERAWDIQKAGNGILLSDVGTDLDGDPKTGKQISLEGAYITVGSLNGNPFYGDGSKARYEGVKYNSSKPNVKSYVMQDNFLTLHADGYWVGNMYQGDNYENYEDKIGGKNSEKVAVSYLIQDASPSFLVPQHRELRVQRPMGVPLVHAPGRNSPQQPHQGGGHQ